MRMRGFLALLAGAVVVGLAVGTVALPRWAPVEDRVRLRAAAGAPTPKPPTYWATDLVGIEQPQVVTGGYTFLSYTKDQQFELVSIAGDTGTVRWRAPAGPSGVTPGVGFYSTTSRDGSLAIWAKPGSSFSRGNVSVVAADAKTGEQVWSFGDDALVLVGSVYRCGTGVVCVQAQSTGEGSDTIVLNERTGEEVPQGNAGVAAPMALSGAVARGRAAEAVCARYIGERLCQTPDEGLAAVDEKGKTVWERGLTEIFGQHRLSPNNGWNVHLIHDQYVGFFGSPDAVTRTGGRSGRVDLAANGATFALDAHTGALQWVRPGTTINCGALDFVPSSPVRCALRGIETYAVNGEQTVSGLAVTLEGFRPMSGEATWRWEVGAVEGLVKPATDVIRYYDTVYAIRTGGKTVEFSLTTGPDENKTPEAGGWCEFQLYDVTSTQSTEGYAGALYFVGGWFPCDTNGQEMAAPLRYAAFATVGGRVWRDQRGRVHGAVFE